MSKNKVLSSVTLSRTLNLATLIEVDRFIRLNPIQVGLWLVFNYWRRPFLSGPFLLSIPVLRFQFLHK